MNELGARMLTVAFSIKGDTSKEMCKELIDEIVRILEMHKAHEPICYNYPVNKTGGFGYTYIQPITESFIAFDAWPDFNGAYLVICSCRLFWVKNILLVLKSFKYKISDVKINELSLVDDELTLG
jgi:hypothetical protein